MPEPMNSRTGWLPVIENDGSSMTSRSIAQVYATTVTPLLADLVQEPVGLQATRQRDARTADDGAAQAHQQPRLMVAAGEAIDGIGAAEVGGRPRVPNADSAQRSW